MTGWAALVLAILIAGILTIRRIERRIPFEPVADTRSHRRQPDPEAERAVSLGEYRPLGLAATREPGGDWAGGGNVVRLHRQVSSRVLSRGSEGSL